MQEAPHAADETQRITKETVGQNQETRDQAVDLALREQLTHQSLDSLVKNLDLLRATPERAGAIVKAIKEKVYPELTEGSELRQGLEQRDRFTKLNERMNELEYIAAGNDVDEYNRRVELRVQADLQRKQEADEKLKNVHTDVARLMRARSLEKIAEESRESREAERRIKVEHIRQPLSFLQKIKNWFGK